MTTVITNPPASYAIEKWAKELTALHSRCTAAQNAMNASHDSRFPIIECRLVWFDKYKLQLANTTFAARENSNGNFTPFLACLLWFGPDTLPPAQRHDDYTSVSSKTKCPHCRVAMDILHGDPVKTPMQVLVESLR